MVQEARERRHAKQREGPRSSSPRVEGKRGLAAGSLRLLRLRQCLLAYDGITADGIAALRRPSAAAQSQVRRW